MAVTYRQRYAERLGPIDKPFSIPRAIRKPLSSIDAAVWPECRSCIAFVDGYFEESLSNAPPSCVLLPLDEAFSTYGLILQSRMNESEPLAILNGASHGRGAFLYVPPGVYVDAPLQIVSILSSDGLMAPRLHLFLGKGAKLDIVQTIDGKGVCVDVIDALLDEDAHLSIADQTQKNGHLFRYVRASLKARSQLKSFSYANRADDLRRNYQISLLGEEAIVDLRGLDRLQGNDCTQTKISVEHHSPKTYSNQHFKKVLQDQSRSRCEGSVRIEKTAPKSKAGQLMQHLILSDQASAEVKPFLDILTDDVEAKHGATFSQPDLEALFYLQSRGISMDSAKALLLEAFCREMIDAIEIPAMRKRL